MYTVENMVKLVQERGEKLSGGKRSYECNFGVKMYRPWSTGSNVIPGSYVVFLTKLVESVTEKVVFNSFIVNKCCEAYTEFIRRYGLEEKNGE